MLCKMKTFTILILTEYKYSVKFKLRKTTKVHKPCVVKMNQPFRQVEPALGPVSSVAGLCMGVT